jgi:quinohemoprotein ethanol dehydrogenase
MMRRMSTPVLMAIGAALVLTGCSRQSAQPEDGVGTDANWTAPGGAADEVGYSRLTSITPDNVGKLGLAWSMDLPDEATLEATPGQIPFWGQSRHRL